MDSNSRLTVKKCRNCPELLTEQYGSGADKCANCQAEENKTKKVTRFEVIDHRRHSSNAGRVFVSYNVNVELSYQDNGKTLKIFVNDRLN